MRTAGIEPAHPHMARNLPFDIRPHVAVFPAARQIYRAFGSLSRPQLQHHGLRGFVHSVSKTHGSPSAHDPWRRESCARAPTQNMDRVVGLEPTTCSVVTGFPLMLSETVPIEEHRLLRYRSAIDLHPLDCFSFKYSFITSIADSKPQQNTAL